MESPGAGLEMIIVSCLKWVLDPNFDPLQEQPVFFTAELWSPAPSASSSDFQVVLLSSSRCYTGRPPIYQKIENRFLSFPIKINLPIW